MRPHARLARVVLLILAAIGAPAAAQPDAGSPGAAPAVRYDGHRVVRVHVRTDEQLQTALALTDDVWSHRVGIGPIEMRVSPEQADDLAAAGLEFEVLIDDLQARLDAEVASIRRTREDRGASWFDNYKTLAEIDARLDNLAAAHPDMAQTFTVGTSLEGRAIRGIRVTGPGDPSGRHAFIFHGCQHAREWITPMTVMWFAERLLEDYATDPRLRTLMDRCEFHLIPVSNPDGYVYTWTSDRLWRKNRRPNGGGSFGVDLNRNWGYQWGGEGASSNPNSETYRGPGPFSEPETQALRDYIIAEEPFVAHIDIHSFSQLILSPWGYSPSLPPDHDLFAILNARMEAAIESVYGTPYTAGPTYGTIYPCSGVALDWSYGARGILGLSFELRDQGQHGFVLPPEQIVPTGVETLAGVAALAEYFAYPIGFEFPQGLPAFVAVDEPTPVRVNIVDQGGTLLPGSGRLFTRLGASGDFVESALAPLGGDAFEASLPAAPCGRLVQYYFQAQGDDGTTVTFPREGAAAPLEAESRLVVVAFDDALETDTGWSASAPGDTATSGRWTRMDPQPTAAQPGDDHTPAPGVLCWVTDGRAGSGVGTYDVDGGATTLTSPRLDAAVPDGMTDAEATISYWRWYSNDQGANPNTNSMPVLISNDDGATWSQLELVTENAGAWVFRSFRIADYVEPTSQMRLRLIARDQTGAVVEAALDDVRLIVAGCPACRADFNGDGDLTVADFTDFRAAFLAAAPAADFDGDGQHTVADFTAFRAAFLAGCP